MQSATMLLILASVGIASGLSFDVEEGKRPVSKVVDLLKGMQAQLDKEAEEDKDTYDKYMCWCKTNGEEKLKAVQEAQEKMPELTARIEYLTSKATKLKSEVEKTEDEVQKNQAALQTATLLREEANKEYQKDLKSAQANVGAVGNALGVLKKGGSFLQQPKGKLIAEQLESLIQTNGDRITFTDRQVLESFLQGQDDPSSDSIAGVLGGMKDDFEFDLKQIKEKEAKDVKEYKELKDLKDQEIAAGTKLIEKKKKEIADANEEKAMKKQDLKDMGATSADDAAAAKEVIKKCEVMDKEFAEREQTRAEESEAISKAVEVLDADEAHEVFGKALSFVQVSSDDAHRDRVVAALTKAGAKDARIMTLAMQAKLDSFTKVKKAIDDMVAALKKQKAEEVEKKEFCVESFRKNEVATQEKTADKSEVESQVEQLKLAVDGFAGEIEAVKAEVVELNKQLALASQNREKENTEFQQVVVEQRQTQELLNKALKVLAAFYEKPSMVQVREHGDQPAEPAGFKDYKKNGQSFGVMSMLRQIIADTKALEAEATRAEASAQEAYETFAKDTTASLDAKQKAIADKTSQKSKAEIDLVQAKKSLEDVGEDLADLGKTKMSLEEDCTFMMKNFDVRQTAIEEEMESLTEAKAILSGAKFA